MKKFLCIFLVGLALLFSACMPQSKTPSQTGSGSNVQEDAQIDKDVDNDTNTDNDTDVDTDIDNNDKDVDTDMKDEGLPNIKVVKAGRANYKFGIGYHSNRRQ